jgi:molybdenum cofactor synthesis domain-containing protein
MSTAPPPSTPPPASRTAAILLIGNELLSGKVDDQNGRMLIRELRELGVSLERIEVVPDRLDDVAASVRGLAARVDTVFTSGGVGPTHDDVTLAAVAAAFDMTMIRHPELERRLRAGFGVGLHDRDLRMADVPAGARLEYGPGGPGATWPVIVVRNVWIFPGVPSIFQRKLAAVRELFRAAPIHARALYSSEGEGAIAAALDEVVAAFPDVDVGSYPHPGAPDYRVKITLDSRDATRLDSALEMLVSRLGPAVVRRD